MATGTVTIETTDKTKEASYSALRQHIASVRASLALLAKQEAKAKDAHSKARQALQAEIDPRKRVALKAEAELAGEELTGIVIQRSQVENNYAGLSRDAAQSILEWLDARGYPALESFVASRQAALDAAQASFNEARAILNTAQDLHAQAAGLCRSIDENFAGAGATNGPEWAANTVDNMWPVVQSLQGQVAKLDN